MSAINIIAENQSGDWYFKGTQAQLQLGVTIRIKDGAGKESLSMYYIQPMAKAKNASVVHRNIRAG